MPLIRKPKDSTPASSGARRPAAPSATNLIALSSANPEERWAAARAAAAEPGAAGTLAQALLAEKDARVQEAMFTSLARIGTADSAALLLPLLRSDNAQLRTGALDALRTMAAAARELLPKMLKDTDADVRILSCELARTIPGDEATTLLCGLLADEQQVNVCAAAIEVLAEVGGPAALPALAQCGQRFREAPFLGFAIKIATDRIKALSASRE